MGNDEFIQVFLFHIKLKERKTELFMWDFKILSPSKIFQYHMIN